MFRAASLHLLSLLFNLVYIFEVAFFVFILVIYVVPQGVFFFSISVFYDDYRVGYYSLFRNN